MTLFSPQVASEAPRIEPAAEHRRPSKLRRLLLGTPSEARWVRSAFLTLLVVTGVAYAWNLSAANYGNEFYAAAVQAGGDSWKAFFFGSADAANFTTVDKPAASIWVMALSVRLFGMSTYAMLIPQVILAVGTIALLYSGIKRWFGPVAATLAGVALAVTPVVSLMFRFNNPDALLVFFEVLGAYFVTRALEKGATKWIVLSGVAVGFAFLAKELQAMLVVPAFGLAYLIAAPVSFKRRVLQVFGALAAVVVSAGWWLLAVTMWSPTSRPYFGGSEDNSIVSVILGGNGVSRITGSNDGGGANFSGAAGPFRLFNTLMGGEGSWLLPAAIVGLIAGLIMVGRAPRTNRARAALILWGTWLITTAVVFSFASGTIHTYYVVALAPAIAALFGIMGARLWSSRSDLVSRVLLAGTVALTGVWSFLLLDQYANWHPYLRYVVAVFSAIAVLGLIVEAWIGRLHRFVGAGIATVALLAALAGPFSYTVSNLSTGETGSIPTSGPITGGMGGGRGGNGGGGFGMDDEARSTVDDQLAAMLQSDASSYRWAAAGTSSRVSAPLQLASGEAVMSIGGFGGSDNDITLQQFQAYVTAGDIHYFVASLGNGGFGGGGMGGGVGSSISSWVAANYTAQTVGGATVYDLSAS